MKSVEQKLLNRYYAADSAIKAEEGWGKGVTKNRANFKALTTMQSKFQLALRRHFRDLANNRVHKMVNWTRFMLESIRAYDYVVDLSDMDFSDEQQLLQAILLDFITQGVGLGVDAGNEGYVHSGLSKTSEAVQEAALKKSSKLVTQITESTRSRIQQSIATSVQLGEDAHTAAKRLSDLIDDPRRAETIARTETRNSYVEGVGLVASETGAVSKDWDPSSDPCPLCQENVDDGTIAIDTDFTNGDDPHPNCLCGAPILNYPVDEAS